MELTNLFQQRLEEVQATGAKEYLKDIKKLNNRTEAIKEIYELYTTKQQQTFRSRENWRRYVSWLKANKVDEKKLGRTATVKVWQKKGKLEHKFLKEMSPKELAIFLAPFNAKNKNLDALYYLASLGRDMNNRKENFSSFLMWSTNYKN